MDRERFNVVGGYLSWLMDSYDLGAVVITATVLGKLFFPTLGVLGAVLPIVFTVVSRPLGGYLFGWLADLRGRRFALLITVLGYSLSIGATALLPTYASVGVIAAILLSVLRLAQGVFIGGDVSSSFTIAMESVRKYRGTFSGIMQSGTLAGFVLVDALFTVFAHNPYFLVSEGWRLIFALGSIPAILAVLIRYRAVEPEIYLKAEKVNPLKGLRPLAQTLLVMIGFWTAIYAGPQYMSVFLGSVKGLSPSEYGPLLLLMNLVGIPTMILAGVASDFVGRKLIGIIGSMIAAAIATWFYFMGVAYLPLSITAFGVAVNIPSGITPAYLSERFRTSSRATGVGFSYNGAFIVAGFSQFLIAYLNRPLGSAVSPVLIFTVGALVSIIGLIIGPETRVRSELPLMS